MFGKASDNELISQALGGSQRAWFRLVTRYEKRLFNYSLRMTGNREDAMDIMQDILMSVYRNLAGFRGDGPFPAWLFRIASFRCTDYLRRRLRQPLMDDEVDSLAAHLPDMVDNIADNRGILAMMGLLPTEQRQVIELKFFQNFTFEEISGQLGISSNTAKSRVYAALKKMRERGDATLLAKEAP